jgi:cytochrome c oxidase subunit 3
MWLALAAITMLFIAMTSAYVVRLGFDPNWRAIRMPPILLVNTVVLLASSVTMEKARRAPGAKWFMVTLLLGLSFLGGQLAAWRQLSMAGIYLGTNPHSSFFYLLTGLHGLHLLGGVAALSHVVFSQMNRERWVDVTALYWHFMDGLWIYLVALLFGWR